jgi:alkanesulfonate monooxygenase SsuD/methylene tetrahydromethanopterin reductase-like flavin-dependent oxidoreductase (luciferase family)
MRIGLINQLHRPPDGPQPAPTWESISQRASVAEAVGFDSFVFEDALLYRDAESSQGCWESVSIAAALAAITSRIDIGPSVFSAPYRSAALTAKIAETIDEISGGRYIFGIGSGNVPDYDYEAFGFPTDHRYSRFAEAIEIIHGLLKDGTVDYAGKYHSARNAELVLRGPRSQGPPIIIAAKGSKMLRLVAQYADCWNWWTTDHRSAMETLRPIIEELERACGEVGRDPATLRRSLDLYTVAPLNQVGDDESALTGTTEEIDGMLPSVLTGTAEEIGGTLLGFTALGFDEIRCDVYPKTVEGIEAMKEIVDLVHAG